MRLNTLKGEVSFSIEGETFTLAFPIDTLIEVEAHFDKPFTQTMGDLLSDRLRMEETRTLFGYGLLARHGDAGMARAGEIIGALGIAETGRLMGLSLLHLFAQPEQGAGAPGPRKPRRGGTGKSASASGSNSTSETPPPSDG